MTREQMRTVVEYTVRLTEQTAPVTIQIGYVDSANQVRHNVIRVLDAPASVTHDLIVFVDAQRCRVGQQYLDASIHGGALHIS